MTDSATLVLETEPVARRARENPDWKPDEVRVISGPKIRVAVKAWRRAHKGWKLHELARSVGVSERTLLYWRTRKEVDMGGNTLLRLAACLGVTIDDLTDPIG